MGFAIPGFKELLTTAKQLVSSYQSMREEFDSQRFFASFRSKTYNPERLNDAAFIEKLAIYITGNKFNYHTMDPTFKNKDYPSVISPFLKEVLSGALLLELIKISGSYTSEKSVKSYSALGKIILDTFKISKLSDVPPEQLSTCLTHLLRFIEVTDLATGKKNAPIAWHTTKSNEELKQEISAELQKLASTKVAGCTM